VFAGAAREVVFSNREVVRKIQQSFVPVALKAALVNNPPGGVEGRLYAEISRSKPAPQGICVANSAGKVLAWALSFDDEESIAGFLDYAAKRFEEFPDAKKPVTAERFMRYPSHKLRDVADNGKSFDVPGRHAVDDRCPGRPSVERGTLVGRVIGRALDKGGHLLTDTLRQEHYMEARFEIPLAVQKQFIDETRKAAGKQFQLPEAFVHSIVEPAYLGQLDVNPMGSVPESEKVRRSIEFLGQQISKDDDAKTVEIRVTGRSDIHGRHSKGGGDGRDWAHLVTLDWHGYIKVTEDQVKRLTLIAEGKEKLRWGNQRLLLTDEVDARHLMAGHPIDLDCGVRYGLIAEPASPKEIVDGVANRDGRPNVLAATPEIAKRLQGKMQHLQAGIKRWQKTGRNPARIGKLMQQFGPLMQQQKIKEAEALLDQALELIENDGKQESKPK